MDCLRWAFLILGLIGSGLVILPTFPTFKPYIVDQARIDKLREGRQILSKEGHLTIDDPAFGLISEIITNESRKEVSNNEIEYHAFHTPEIEYKLNQGNSFVDRGAVVYAVDSAGKNAIDSDENLNPIAEGNSEIIGSMTVVDIWVTDKIENLKEEPIERVRGFGFLLIVISTFIQGGTAIPV